MKNFWLIALVIAVGFVFYLAYHKNETKPIEPTLASPYQDEPIKSFPAEDGKDKG